MSELPLPPGSTLGILGGGQLGRMLAQAAARLGFDVAVLEREADSPAGRVAAHTIVGPYADPDALEALAAVATVVTYEFENVPSATAEFLAARVPVRPGPHALAICQHRVREKQFLNDAGVGTTRWGAALNADDVARRVSEFGAPCVLKTSRFGYDGKGQARVANVAEARVAFDSFKREACVLEKMLPLQWECSVIVARGADGACVNLPVQRNLHRDGILAVTQVYEGVLPAQRAAQAVAATRSIADGLQYVGVLCVEFFVLADGSLVVNEMAPRPHNSGHWSMDGCDVSQFELQVRAMAGLPLVQPRQHSPSIMLNLLGDLWFARGAKETSPPWDQVLALSGTHLHLYGKLSARPGRKMGHLNITGASIEAVRATALQACALLGLEAF